MSLRAGRAVRGLFGHRHPCGRGSPPCLRGWTSCHRRTATVVDGLRFEKNQQKAPSAENLQRNQTHTHTCTRTTHHTQLLHGSNKKLREKHHTLPHIHTPTCCPLTRLGPTLQQRGQRATRGLQTGWLCAAGPQSGSPQPLPPRGCHRPHLYQRTRAQQPHSRPGPGLPQGTCWPRGRGTPG